MPDSIIKIIEVKRSLYDPYEPVIVLEALANSKPPLKYTRTIRLKDAFKDYDILELRAKLEEYYQKLSEKTILTRRLLIALEMKP